MDAGLVLERDAVGLTVPAPACASESSRSRLARRGASREEILAAYPLLEDAHIITALEHAARLSHHPVLRVA
jgi:hypothetical protein